jgi:peptidoglycan/LPS O-acetylase OafA/YrhL
VRRGLKIYPAFYFLILITLIILVYSGQGINLKKLFSEIFFLQNYFTGIHSHTWSLAVEEQFYILIALIFIFMLKYQCKYSWNPFAIVPALFAICFFVCSLFRLLNYLEKNEYSHAAFLYPLHLRADSLMFGVLISYHWHFNSLKEKIDKVKSIYLISAAIILFVPVFIFPIESYYFISVFWLAPLYIASGLLLIAALRIDVVNAKVLIITTSLGAASYSIYLWHIPVGTWGWALFKKISPSDSFLVYFSFYIIGSYLIGWIFFKIFEFPILKMRDKLIPSTTGRSA